MLPGQGDVNDNVAIPTRFRRGESEAFLVETSSVRRNSKV